MLLALRIIPTVILRVLFAAILHDAGRHDYDASDSLKPQYDFIIVGGGSAGGALAARLSEIPGWRILLLEAGGKPPPESNVPALNQLLMQGEADWNYFTTSQNNSHFAFEKQRAALPLGRVIGGSSSINWMMYVRGNRRDYDNWASLGNDGWDYNNVLKYFKKSEDYRGSRNKETLDYHGKGGPLAVEDKRWGAPVLEGFLKAGEQLGYDVIDPNGPEQIGFSVADMTQRNGLRGSTAVSYIRPAAQRPNFDVAMNAHVTQVLFDEYKKAIGVAFEQRGQLRKVFAQREVILSAGAIGSPHLLLLSGVGPADHLKQHGIPLVLDLAGVGQNLQEHPCVYGLTWTTAKETTSNLFNFANPKVIKEYAHHRRGPLTTPFGVEGNAWSLSEEGDAYWPDLQYAFYSGSPATDYGVFMRELFGIRKEVFNELYGPLRGRDTISIVPILTRSKSRGSVTLASKNPKTPPNIDVNLLSHPDDINTFIRGIQFALKIGGAPGLKEDFGARFHDKPLSGCLHHQFGSDDYWRCYIRHLASITFHPAGTCKMAPSGDPYGVVDNRLKVRGIRGLRVVDNSIMPLITSGNTNAPAIMIGEKAADLIKEDWAAPITPSH